MPVIPDVPAFKLELDSGNMAFLAAQAALSVAGVACSVARLAGASGDAFKFVYDTAPVFEPLRDLRPWDTLARAFAACGLRAEWVPDATLDHVRGQVEAQAEVKQPVLSNSLPGTQGSHFYLLTGYDEGSDTLYYQAAARNPTAGAAYDTIALHDGVVWHGPLTGAPHWANFPMLVIRGPLYNPPDEKAQRRLALESALAVLNGDPIPYPAHPGAANYAKTSLASRKAQQGLLAFDYLARDLAEADLHDFATIWRIDAQLNQLAWDRTLAVHYLESWERDTPEPLVAQYHTIAHTARTLLTRNWERRSATMYSLDTLTGFIEGTAAYLYALPDDPKTVTDLTDRDLGKIMHTPWGMALLVDTRKRRESAARLANRLLEHEQACIKMLENALQKL